MTQPLRIGLVGLGTVGAGVIRLLHENGALIARRAGRPLEIVAVTARDRGKDRGVDLSPYRWVDDMGEMASDDSIDLVAELIGGSDGPALTLARETLRGGKHFVTANKAMIAHHGMELSALAEAAGTGLKFEAAVAGGIPALKGIGEGAAANRIDRVYGILNGTCNYILSCMEADGSSFADVLKEAQALGYAEADPTFDVEGIDAAHKLAILASLAFGSAVDFTNVCTQGISQIMAADIAQADRLGYRIRLLGFAEQQQGADGGHELVQRVHPYLVPKNHPLAFVNGPTNAVVVEGNHAGRLLFQGAGAGDGPTASAVVADIIDIARGFIAPAFAMPCAELKPFAAANTDHRMSRTYMRFDVVDRPGVLAEITAAMRDAGVSIESLLQREEDEDDEAIIAIVTHEVAEGRVSAALAALASSPSLRSAPVMLRILT